MTFELIRFCFRFRAAEPLYFPPGKAVNTFRGAFGMLLRQTASPAEYARIFEPQSTTGPSGLADPPRCFVIRASHLDGINIRGDQEFHFDVHLFDLTEERRETFIAAFSRLVDEGLGPHRARAKMLSAGQEHIAIDLDAPPAHATGVRVQFLTPTELKAAEQVAARPEFPILFARLRDRISTLRSLYGGGALKIDFHGMGERAAAVRLSRCDLTWHHTQRRSSRTGQTHPIGGFTGMAEYDGDLGEFLPYLRAGQWTGVGRQTVWGKGEICFQLCG